MTDETEVTKAKAKGTGKGAGKKAGAGGAKAVGGAKAAGAGKGNKAAGAGADGAPKVEGQIGRMLVRAIWAQEWTLANPDAKGEQRKVAWKDAREGAMERNLKSYRRALNSLTRSGVTRSEERRVGKECRP